MRETPSVPVSKNGVKEAVAVVEGIKSGWFQEGSVSKTVIVAVEEEGILRLAGELPANLVPGTFDASPDTVLLGSIARC